MNPPAATQSWENTPQSALTLVQPTLDQTFTVPCKGILVGVAGSVSGLDFYGNAQTAPLLAAGVVHPICWSRINTSGTTATGIRIAY